MNTTIGMKPKTIATVAICTRNRAGSLARTLESIAAAAAGVSVPWDLLVIDNGSTDQTMEVVAGFGDRLPIRAVFEGKAGLSNARNAAVANADGEYIIWTDDDVIVDAGWLAAYIDAFQKSPEAAIFGGRAVPRYVEPTQKWFVDSEQYLPSLLAIRNSTDWHEIITTRVPFGLNYAVRMTEQRLHPYDPELGVAPGRRRGGEEVAMIRSALAAGSAGVWVWGAGVHHLIPRARQTVKYIYEYYYSNGYDFPSLPLDDTGARIGGVPIKLFLLIARKGVMTLLRFVTRRPAWVGSLVEFSRCIGSVGRFRAEASTADKSLT